MQPSLSNTQKRLGPACVFLSITEKAKVAVVKIISVYGTVPRFYYLIHMYVIHLITLFASAILPGHNWHSWILKEPIWTIHQFHFRHGSTYDARYGGPGNHRKHPRQRNCKHLFVWYEYHVLIISHQHVTTLAGIGKCEPESLV